MRTATRFPGEFSVTPENLARQDDSSSYVVRPRRRMSSFRPVPASRHTTKTPLSTKACLTVRMFFCETILYIDILSYVILMFVLMIIPVIRHDVKTITIQQNSVNVRVTLDRGKSPSYCATNLNTEHQSDATFCD